MEYMYLYVKCLFKLLIVGIVFYDILCINSDFFMIFFFLSFINDLRERGIYDVFYLNFIGVIVIFNCLRLDG